MSQVSTTRRGSLHVNYLPLAQRAHTARPALHKKNRRRERDWKNRDFRFQSETSTDKVTPRKNGGEGGIKSSKCHEKACVPKRDATEAKSRRYRTIPSQPTEECRDTPVDDPRLDDTGQVPFRVFDDTSLARAATLGNEYARRRNSELQHANSCSVGP